MKQVTIKTTIDNRTRLVLANGANPRKKGSLLIVGDTIVATDGELLSGSDSELATAYYANN